MKTKIIEYNHADPLTPDQMQELMEIEVQCFSEELQESEDSKRLLIESAQIVLFAIDNLSGKIIGEAYCIIDEPEWADHPDDQAMHELFEQMDMEDGIYFMSFAVLPDYRGKGIAGNLLNEMLIKAKELQFNYLYTHAKMGASAHLFGKAGGQYIETRSNWFGTGNDYLLFCIPLQE